MVEISTIFTLAARATRFLRIQRTEPGLENRYACGYFPLYGDFRGEYTLREFVPLDFGFDFYAPQTFWDGSRRLLTAWMGMADAEYINPTTAYGWQHCLTVLRELRFEDGRLRMRPVRELDALREEMHIYPFSNRLLVDLPELADIQISCEGKLALKLSGISLKAGDGSLTLAIQEGGYGRDTRRALTGELRDLRILVDTSAIEIFANDGEVVFSTRWYPPEARRSLTLYGTGNIGVLVADRYFVGSPFYATLYRSLVLSGTQSGVTCMMESVSPEAERDRVQPTLVSGRNVKALIFMGSFNHAYVQSVIEYGLPFVLLDFSFQDIRITA